MGRFYYLWFFKCSYLELTIVIKWVVQLLAMGLLVWMAATGFYQIIAKEFPDARNRHRTPLDNTGYTGLRKELDNILRPLRNDAVIVQILSLMVNPHILLIGESGSGKSSLMSAITQIPLTTAEGGGNDRCPVKVRLTRRGQVPFPIYQVSVSNSDDGLQPIGETADKEELQALMQRAYLVATVAEAPISNDMIQVDVLGADVDAEFIELPGLNPVIYRLTTLADKN